MRQTVLVDTGPVVALLSTTDRHHILCSEQFKALQTPLLTCWPVLTEAVWLLRHNASAVQRLLKSTNSGFLQVLGLDDNAGPWLAAFLDRYQDLGAELADACLVYLAEQEDIGTVFTLDRRDFSVYRYSKNKAFMLLPDPDKY